MPINLKNRGEKLTSVVRGAIETVPPRWRAKLGFARVVQKVPLAVEPDRIGGPILASQVMQELTDERTKTDTKFDGDPRGKTMVEYIRTKDGQVGTRTVRYLPEGTKPPTFDELDIEYGQDASGNGWSEVIQTRTPNLFAGFDYTVELRDVIPPEFAALLQTKEESSTIAGIAVMPTLAVGELVRKETQITEQTKRIFRRYRDVLSLPKVIVDKGITEQFGGATTTITKTLDLDAVLTTVSTGLLVIKSEINRLGNGMSVKASEVADGASWALLHGQDYDERFDVLIPFTERVVDPGTGLGAAHTEVKPIDKWREHDRTIDIAAVEDFLNTYALKYFGKVNVDLPDKLVGITAQPSTDNASGSSSETGTFSGTGAYSVQQSLRASAQSSASVLMEVITDIKQFWGSNVKCTNVQFFLPSPVVPADVITKLAALLGASVAEWPKYNPQMVTLLVKGGRVSVQVAASSQGSYSISSSGTSSTAGGGTGFSKEIGLSLKSVRVSPTIHAALTVGGTTTDTENVSATASAVATGLGPSESHTESESVTGAVTPTSIAATVGATDWPTTGLYLFKVDAQPYRFGYIQFHCVVVDAADFPSS